MDIRKLFYLVWIIFPVSNVIFLLIGFYLIEDFRNEFVESGYIYLSIGLIAFLSSVILSKKIYSEKQIHIGKLAKLLSKMGKRQFRDSKFGLLFSFFQLTIILSETCGIMGLICFLQTSNIICFISLISLGFLSWLYNFPRIKEYEINVLGQN